MNPTQSLARVREAFQKIKVTDAIRERAAESLATWLSDEAFEDARPQLESLIERESFSWLFDAFFQEIPFGTGGRRGPVGFGPNRINPFTISTSIQGHAVFLQRRFGEAGRGGGAAGALSVVIAYDVRVYKDLRKVYDPDRPNPLLEKTSLDFARIAASVYAANGVRVWMPNPAEGKYISTPELSFAIRKLGARGGLNISASHNHPDDNGAKIYNEKGSQEIPPVDEELAKIVEATRTSRSIPFEEAVQKGLVRWIPAEVSSSYLETNARLMTRPAATSARIVFTPLHGTGLSSAGASLSKAGFQVIPLEEQKAPDGTFPTVPFRSPNPEVRESLALGARHAAAQEADLLLGTDPDADRLGMMAPHGGEWVFFTGNEIGVILAYYLFRERREATLQRGTGHPFAVTTVVTTSLFGRIARSAGAKVVDDLNVGFKYIGDVLNTIERTGRYRDIKAKLEDFVLGIEESHGYLLVPWIRDKDAAGAAVILGEIASTLRARKASFTQYLDQAYKEFGYVRNALRSTVMVGAQGFINIRKIQDSLRAQPPTSIAGRKVLEVEDRWDEAGPLGRIVSETDRMSRDMLIYRLDGGARITLRPSGTESKNKVYVEVGGAPLGADASDSALAAEKSRLNADADQVGRGFAAEMLSRIGVTLAGYALDVSDLVTLENKMDFAGAFLPELLARLDKGEGGAPLDAWVDQRLRPYGNDARLLVRGAVHSFLSTETVPGAASAYLKAAFLGSS